jgi:hypothetical protein
MQGRIQSTESTHYRSVRFYVCNKSGIRCVAAFPTSCYNRTDRQATYVRCTRRFVRRLHVTETSIQQYLVSGRASA